MKKVYLIIEEYTELSRAQNLLKKLSFDVLSVQNDMQLSEHTLSFNPDAMVVFGHQRFTSLSVGQKLKDQSRYQGKVILILPAGARPGPQDLAKVKMDGMIEAPVLPIKLIQVLCKVLNLDPVPILEKYAKAQFVDPSTQLEESTYVGGKTESLTKKSPASSGADEKKAKNKQESPLTDKERVTRYAQYLNDPTFEKGKSSHQRKEVKERQKDLQKDWDDKVLEEQDKLRREFAEALFKKNN